MKSRSEYLEEILSKGGISILAFFYKRLLMTVFSYLTTNLVGANIYGYLSVLIRGEKIIHKFTGFICTSNVRTLPRLDKKESERVYTISLLILLIVCSLILILTYIMADSIVDYTILEPRHKSLVKLSVLFFVSVTFLSFVSSIYKARKETRKSVIISQCIRPSCYVLSICVAILIAINTATGVWIPAIVLITILSTLSLGFVFRELSLTSDIRYRSRITKEYVLHTLHMGVLGVISILHRDFVFVAMSFYLSPVSAGLFSLSLILADTCRWALSGINKIFPPIASKLCEQDDMKKLNNLYQSTSKIATIISCLPVVVVSAYHEEIMTLFSPQYANDSIVLLVAVIAQVSATVIGSVGLLLVMTDNERLSVYVNITNAILLVPTSIYFASKFGVFGLSIAFLITMVYNNVAELIVLYYSEGLMSLTKNHIYILVLTALFSICSVLIRMNTSVHIGFVSSLLLSAFLGLICYRYLLYPYEKESLSKINLVR